jgi:hypothetical protein
MMEFNSFAKFAEHLLVVGVEQHLADHELLESAAVQIERRAKEKIGEYQDAAGPFEAWQPLAPATVEQRVALGYAPDDPLLRDGTLRDSIEHKVEGREAHIGSDLDIALWQELGTEKIPPRSFLGGSAFELAPKIVREIGVAFSTILAGGGRKIPIE